MEKRKENRVEPGGAVPAGSRLRLAFGPFARARGLLGCEGFDGMLMIAPCRDVHTAGMASPIDVAFVDARGMVVESHRRVGPFRRLRNRRAVCVIERISRCESPWFKQGERVTLSEVRGTDEERSR